MHGYRFFLKMVTTIENMSVLACLCVFSSLFWVFIAYYSPHNFFCSSTQRILKKLFKANLLNWVHVSSALGAKAVLSYSYRKANFYNKTKSTNIHWVWSFITKWEVNLWFIVLYQKQMKLGNFRRVQPCSFGLIQTLNSKWNWEMWT